MILSGDCNGRLQIETKSGCLILESSDDGEINVDVALHNDGAGDSVLATALCKVIAQKLTSDEQFQAEIMAELN